MTLGQIYGNTRLPIKLISGSNLIVLLETNHPVNKGCVIGRKLFVERYLWLKENVWFGCQQLLYGQMESLTRMTQKILTSKILQFDLNRLEECLGC